jgi:hypothetical protein
MSCCGGSKPKNKDSQDKAGLKVKESAPFRQVYNPQSGFN